MRAPWLAGCVLAAGCLPSNFFPIHATAAEPSSSSESSGSTGEPGLPTTSGSTGSTGSTGEESTTGESSSTSEGSSGMAMEEPPEPPTIIKVTFSPNPVTAAGAVAVAVETAHADAVSMAALGNPAVELPEERPQKFADATAIAVVSAEANGKPHCAAFKPWREGEPGTETIECFTVQLPQGGTETYWEGAPDKGTGAIAALATLPEGHVVEFGTYYPNGQPRCYLRRRDQGGAWSAEDFVDSFVAETCTATDMVITDDGELYLLAEVITNGDPRWWLGLMAGWKGTTKKVGGGIAGATGRALAREKDGERVAVCGTYPTQAPDVIDAAVWLFEQGKPGLNTQFDYAPPTKDLHSFGETPRDCAFRGGDLVLVGEVKGNHGLEMVLRKRHFLLEYGPMWPGGHFSVAGPDKGVESGASAVTVDGDGNYVTAGYTCGAPCDEKPQLRVFAPGGAPLGQIMLPEHLLVPLDLAYGPAGYVVLATGTDTNPSKFIVQAWYAGLGVHVWTYEHKGAPSSEIGTALAVSPYGQVYAGGISAAGYPAVAFIAP